MSIQWVPVFVAFIAAFLGMAAYWNQKRLDRKATLYQKRREVYQAFLETLFDHTEERSENFRKRYDRSKCELLLVASDSVLRELPMVQEASVMDMDSLGPGDVHQRVVDLIKAMRRDCFEKTNIEGWDFEYLVPIGKPTPVTPKLDPGK